jgi:hypothetical protein
MMFPGSVHVLFLFAFTQLLCVSAFAAFVPDSNNVMDDISYDEISKPDISQTEDGQFYKMLSKILTSYLNRLEQRHIVDGYLSNTNMPYNKPSKRTSDAFTGFAKRKVFWQPLGYNPTGGSGENRGSSGSGRGPVFRYG